MVIPDFFPHRLKTDTSAVQIAAIRAYGDLKTSELLSGWVIIGVDETMMRIKLTFKDPVEISKGDYPDMLLIQLEIKELKSIQDGINLPESIVKLVEIPT